MKTIFREVAGRRGVRGFTLGALLAFVSCTNFPTPFENVVAGQKIRPFAVVCDQPEAAPGDTVSVRLYYYDPPGDHPAIHWLVSLDYGTDLRGGQFENHVVNLDSMMLPGSAPDSFRFRVPDSMFFYSTQISELVGNPHINTMHLTIAAVDSLLRTAARAHSSSPQLLALADNFSCRLRLRAQMRSTISVDVTMLLQIRYSSRLKSPAVHENPVIGWMGILKVPSDKYTSIDSLAGTGATLQYLFNGAHPDSVRDTVVIDSGFTYFVSADSEGGYGQIYQYLSLSDNSMALDTERHNYSWLFSNLDYSNGMVMDSLIMFGQARAGPIRSLLPPVDTAMHRFELYLVVRSVRRLDPNSTPGEAFRQADGYFSYTDSYARSTIRKAGGRRLF